MNFQSFSWLLILSGIILLGAIVGSIIPFVRDWKQRHLHSFISFGAGVLIGAAFIYMIPEATELIGGAVGWGVLIGFLIFYLLEKFVMIHPCTEQACEFHHIGIPAFLGFSFHNLTDGIALGSSFLVPALTPSVFFALLSHHLPTSFALASILKVSRYSVRQILLLLALFSVMIPFGAISSHTTLRDGNQAALGWAIAFSAGTFIHIAICDLLPEIHKYQENKFRNLWAFLLGLGMMIVASLFFAH